jgi:hypothetical protein
MFYCLHLNELNTELNYLSTKVIVLCYSKINSVLCLTSVLSKFLVDWNILKLQRTTTLPFLVIWNQPRKQEVSGCQKLVFSVFVYGTLILNQFLFLCPAYDSMGSYSFSVSPFVGWFVRLLICPISFCKCYVYLLWWLVMMCSWAYYLNILIGRFCWRYGTLLLSCIFYIHCSYTTYLRLLIR